MLWPPPTTHPTFPAPQPDATTRAVSPSPRFHQRPVCVFACHQVALCTPSPPLSHMPVVRSCRARLALVPAAAAAAATTAAAAAAATAAAATAATAAAATAATAAAAALLRQLLGDVARGEDGLEVHPHALHLQGLGSGLGLGLRVRVRVSPKPKPTPQPKPNLDPYLELLGHGAELVDPHLHLLAEGRDVPG